MILLYNAASSYKNSKPLSYNELMLGTTFFYPRTRIALTSMLISEIGVQFSKRKASKKDTSSNENNARK